jgi:hypothetical protein
MNELLDKDDEVYRRILPCHFIHDSNLGRSRPSSAAFERRSDEEHASCYVGSLLSANDLQPLDVLDKHEALGLVSATVQCLRTYGCDARPDPHGLDADNPHKCDAAHGALIEPPVLAKSGIKKNWAKFAKDPAIGVLVAPREVP